jgi:copper(I)-binding protein
MTAETGVPNASRLAYMQLLLWLSLALPVSGADLEVREAWLRALPPGQPTAAVYLTLRNGGAGPARLTGAVTEWAERAELHESRQVDGSWHMGSLEYLVIPAGGTVALEPGGVHLMLFGLRRSPRAGDTLELSLSFAGGETLAVEARVLAAGAAARHH